LETETVISRSHMNVLTATSHLISQQLDLMA